MQKEMEKWLGLPEEKLLALVPDRAGLYFVGCPNCTGGVQENQLQVFTPDEPDIIRCQYCHMAYPNEKYPDSQIENVLTPGGNTITYPYYENKEGYRYYFTASVAFHKRLFAERLCLALAQKWQDTNDVSYGRKAALMLYRFSAAWPDFCWHYDYPFIQKKWYQGYVAPSDCKPYRRTARYHWWGYLDLKDELLSAYDMCKEGSFWVEIDKSYHRDARYQIEAFFRDNADHLMAQANPIGNMDPYLWRSIVKLGRILGDAKYVHYPLPGLKKLLAEGFFADGVWHEGTPAYMAQTIDGVISVCRTYDGWVDPPGYVPVEPDGYYLDGRPVERLFPEIKRAKDSLAKLHFPHSGQLTLHDSWGHKEYPYPKVPDDHKEASFILPALGHGCLTGGEGMPTGRLDLTWSGGYGHQHMDGLSMTVTAFGHEMLSDIGYTHSKYRCWTSATLAHNTVLLDGGNQHRGGQAHATDGNCRYFFKDNHVFQTMSVDNPTVYPGVAEEYRRSMARVQIDRDHFYLVDLFKVKGGGQHDYILHGDCIAEQKTVIDWPKADTLAKVVTLVPKGVDFTPPEGEHHYHRCDVSGYAYGFMREMEEIQMEDNGWMVYGYEYTGLPLGPASVRENRIPDAFEKQLGIRLYGYGCKGDRIIKGYAPSVRQGQENDDLLDLFMRPFVMVRRNPDKNGSLFCTIMEPFSGAEKIEEVGLLYNENDGIVLKIETEDFYDLLFYGLKERIDLPLDDNRLMTISGEYGFARIKQGCLVTAVVSCGIIKADGMACLSETEKTGRIVDVILGEEDSRVVVLDPEGTIRPKIGETILVRRVDRTFAYHVKDVTRHDAMTTITLAGWLGFMFDKTLDQSTDLCFPGKTYHGAHEVIWKPVVSHSR